jgi:hypothetical protein
MDLATVIADITQKKWMALAVLIIGYLHVLFSNASTFPVNIPTRFRPLVVIIFGQGYTIISAVSGGEACLPAIEHGLLIAFTTMGLAQVLTTLIFPNGLPSWLKWVQQLAMVPSVLNISTGKPKEALPQKTAVSGQT